MKRTHGKIWEIYTWIIIILAIFGTALLVTISPELANKVLPYIIALTVGIMVYWYLTSHRLYEDTLDQTEELLSRQKEIKNRQKTIDLIFENSADGIMVLDDEQRIESFSPGMEKVTGYKKEEVLGRLAQKIFRFKGDRENSLLPDVMFLPRDIKKRPYVKNTLSTKDGREINIEAGYTLITPPNTHHHKGLAIIRDVTYEQELVRRDKEFIAITSHQLNTPLSIIRGYLSLIKSGNAGELTKKQSAYINETYEAVLKMISLTNNLLSISRIEQDKIQLAKEDINVKEFFLNLKNTFDPIAKEKKVKLTFSSVDPNLILYADPNKIHQALSNVIDNAIKYAKEGSVNVQLKNDNNQLIFTIADNGIGIPEEEIEKIGQKFYRTQDAINVDNKGTGLGVFITKTIVEKHGGNFNISGVKGKGTTITISLPIK